MTVSNFPNPNSSRSSSDGDVEEDTHMPSPRAPTHGKGLASASEARQQGKKLRRKLKVMMMVVVMMRKKIFDVEEITPTSYMHMGTLIFCQPQNPDWREKISYKGKTEFVREKKKENPRLFTTDPIKHLSKTFMSR
jgi:hypothetical protein